MSAQSSSAKSPQRIVPVFKVWADQGSHPPVKLDRRVCVIGRREVGVHLPLQSPQVSKMHALVVRDARGVYLRDLASTNGVQRNGAPVQEIGLTDDDVLRIGSYTLRCDSGFSRDGKDGTPPAAAELAGEGIKFPFPVGQQTVLIGRRVGCDLRLDEEDVAPVHAIVFELDGQRFVRDLNAPGGTYVNGQKVHQEALGPGDELRVGSVTMRYAPIDVLHEEPDIPPLDGPQIPELDEPQIARDEEPALAAMDESRIPLLDESSASVVAEALQPMPAPTPTRMTSEALPRSPDESRIPLLDESTTSVAAADVVQPEPTAPKSETRLKRPGESQIGMHDSLISIEDSQAPGTPDVGPLDSSILEPQAPHEPSFHGEIVEFAGEVFPVNVDAAATKPPVSSLSPLMLEASSRQGNADPIDDRAKPMGSHVDDEQPAAPKAVGKPEEITQLVEDVAEKAETLKSAWGQYASKNRKGSKKKRKK